MKKNIKKVVAAASAAILCAIPMTNATAPVSAYGTNQKLTYRIYEKVHATKLKVFSSTLKVPSNYTYGSCALKDFSGLFVDSGFNSTSHTAKHDLILSLDNNGVTGTGYMFVSTWYVPNTTKTFSLTYSFTKEGTATVETIPVLVGDIDQDGDVDKTDAEKILTYYSQISAGTTVSPKYSTKGLLAADVNQDGKINTTDANLVLRFAGGENIKFS